MPEAVARAAAAAEKAAMMAPGTTSHDLYAQKAFTCEACHPCGVKSADGHLAPWMDTASGSFHAYTANSALASCQACHGQNLDGAGGSTPVSCAQCHGAAWQTDCVMCHGGMDGTDGAPPRTTWGRDSDPVRVGAHTAHLAAPHSLSQPVACGVCHPVPASALSPGHADAATATVTISGLGAWQATGARWDRPSATCAGTYCHGATLDGGALKAPPWTLSDGTARACGACHGAPPPAPHLQNDACGSCHAGYGAASVNLLLHVDGKIDVRTDIGCTTCHGSAGNAAPPAGTRGETLTTQLAVGAHQAHLAGGDLSKPIACAECHAVPSTMDHYDGTPDVAWGTLATHGGAVPQWDRATATCSASYCHGQFEGGELLNAPSWIAVDGTQDRCGSCHGAPPPEPHPQLADCERCHPAGYAAGGVDLDRHVNGIVEVSVTCTSCHGAGASPAPPVGTHGETLTTQRAVGAHQAHLGGTALRTSPIACTECHAVPADMGHADGAVQLAWGPLATTAGNVPRWDGASCSSTYCHGATLRGGGLQKAPSWTGGPAEAACGTCHTTPPPAPHPHTSVCENCHPGYTLTSVNPATHINGLVEAENLTCSSCHGDDTRVLVMSADARAIAAPPYGSRGETDPATPSVGQHMAHVNRGNGVALPNKCDYCHAVPTTFDHANGKPEVAFASLATMDGAVPRYENGTCFNTYCHGATLGRGGTDHSPTWTNPAAVTCQSCHGVPPPLPHPQDSDCIRCHPGYTSTSVRKATHVNGISDFPNGCNSCHENPPSSGEHYEHLHHNISCSRCHAGYTTTTANETLHRNAVQDVTLSGWNARYRTCSNIGCHGSEYWGRGGSAARQSCNQCHGVPPRSGEHYEHSEFACSRCHGTGYSTTTTNGATHMNTVVDVPFAWYNKSTLTCTYVCHGSERWGQRVPVTPNCGNCHGFPPGLPHPQQSTCQDCHPSMASTGVLTEEHNNGVLDISGVGCTSCHGFPPSSTRAGGAHPADPNCYGCHSITVDAQNQVLPNGSHNDGYVQVGGGGVGTYGCQTCHGDQARTAPAGTDPNMKAAPPLGTRGETEVTSRAVGSHLAHVSGAAGALAAPARCAECHVVPTAMDHATGEVVIQFGGRAIAGGAGPQYDAPNFTCNNTYCHGATLGAGGTHTAPTWTGGTAEASCGTCHAAPPPAPHPARSNCGGCHPGYGTDAGTVNAAKHVNGTLDVALTCNGCHGSAANDAPPLGVHGETLTTDRAVGAHQSHVAGGPIGKVACAECHAVPTAMDHSDGAVQLAWGTIARTGGANPSFDGATCSNTYCHGATLAAGGTLTAPTWTKVDGTQAACGTCHGAPPPAPHSTNTSCGSCHDGYTATTVNPALHVNGILEARASPHAAGWSDKTQHGYQADLTGLAGCKSCHGDLGPTTSCGTCHASAGFATWDTNCTFCHGSTVTGRQNPPVDIRGRSVTTNVSVGVHESHATTTIATFLACTQCHPARTASVRTDTAHVDGNGIAEVAMGPLAKTGGAAATYTRVSATSATCASTYCHGRFSGGANSGNGATVNWTSTTQVGCTSCHGNPPSSGRHSTHSGRAACYNCHNGVVASGGTTFVDKTLHVNGVDNVKLGGTYSGRTVSGTWNATSRSCSNLSCHGSKSW